MKRFSKNVKQKREIKEEGQAAENDGWGKSLAGILSRGFAPLGAEGWAATCFHLSGASDVGQRLQRKEPLLFAPPRSRRGVGRPCQTAAVPAGNAGRDCCLNQTEKSCWRRLAVREGGCLGACGISAPFEAGCLKNFVRLPADEGLRPLRWGGRR